MKAETLKTMIDDFKSGTTNFTVDGKCSNCGECCSDWLPISREEVRRIHRYVRQHNIKERHNNVMMMGLTADITCPFRDNVKRKCTIYEVRPEICRAFKCDTAWSKVEMDKKVFHQKNDVVSMRAEFFNDESALLLIKQIMGEHS